MSNSEVLDKLEEIKENQKQSNKLSAIAFGISIVIISFNFLTPAIAAKNCVLIAAAGILGLCGLVIMSSPAWKRLKKSKEDNSKR